MADEQSNGKQREQTEDEALVAFRELRARVGTGNGDRSSLSVPGSQGQEQELTCPRYFSVTSPTA